MSVEKFLSVLMHPTQEIDFGDLPGDDLSQKEGTFVEFPGLSATANDDFENSAQPFEVDIVLESVSAIDVLSTQKIGLMSDEIAHQEITFLEEPDLDVQRILQGAVCEVSFKVLSKIGSVVSHLEIPEIIFTKHFQILPFPQITQREQEVDRGKLMISVDGITGERQNIYPVLPCGGFLPANLDLSRAAALFFTIHSHNLERVSLRIRTQGWWQQQGLLIGQAVPFGSHYYCFADAVERLPSTLAEDIFSGEIKIRDELNDIIYRSYTYEVVSCDKKIIRLGFKNEEDI